MSIFEKVEKEHAEAARKAKAEIVEKIFANFGDLDAPTPLKIQEIKEQLATMEAVRQALTFYSDYLIEEARRNRRLGHTCNCGSGSATYLEGITFCRDCSLPRKI
jgi:hypothetical protein